MTGEDNDAQGSHSRGSGLLALYSAIAVALIGAAASIVVALIQNTPEGDGDSSGVSGAPTFPTPSQTLTVAAPRSPVRPTRGDEVSIAADESRPGVTLLAKRAPQAGTSFWLVVEVDFGKGVVEHYAQREVGLTPGREQSFGLAFDDVTNKRVARVFELDAVEAQPLRDQVALPPSKRNTLPGWPCDDCGVSAKVTVTPLQ